MVKTDGYLIWLHFPGAILHLNHWVKQKSVLCCWIWICTNTK